MSRHLGIAGFQGNFQGATNPLSSLGSIGSSLALSGGNPLLAAGLFAGGQLLGGIGGLLGGREREGLEIDRLRQLLEQSGISFGRRGELFEQLQGLIGKPLISQGRHSVLFNRATQGSRQNFLRRASRGPGGISSPVANAAFSFGTAGAQASSFLDFIRQGANRDIGLFGIGSSLTRG